MTFGPNNVLLTVFHVFVRCFELSLCIGSVYSKPQCSLLEFSYSPDSARVFIASNNNNVLAMGCSRNPCQNEAECQDVVGGVICICQPVWTGVLCETGRLAKCQDVLSE